MKPKDKKDWSKSEPVIEVEEYDEDHHDLFRTDVIPWRKYYATQAGEQAKTLAYQAFQDHPELIGKNLSIQARCAPAYSGSPVTGIVLSVEITVQK